MAEWSIWDILQGVMAYDQYRDSKKPPKQTPLQLTPEQRALFDRYIRQWDTYTGTQAGLSNYMTDVINQAGQSANFQPTYRSEYMSGEKLPTSPIANMTLFPGTSTAAGDRPWGSPTAPGPRRGGGTLPNGGRIHPNGLASGGSNSRVMHADPGTESGSRSAWDDLGPTGGPIGTDASGNPFFNEDGGIAPSTRPHINQNDDGTYTVSFPNGVTGTLTPEQYKVLEGREEAFSRFISTQTKRILDYAKENKLDFIMAALALFGL